MRFSHFWKLFHRKPEFYALRSENDNDEEDGIESKELLEKRTLARKPAHSTAWIFLTITNVVILSINIFLLFSGKKTTQVTRKMLFSDQCHGGVSLNALIKVLLNFDNGSLHFSTHP